MQILYFSPRECWPLNTGARLRDYHLARQLAREASVTYLGLYPHNQPPVAFYAAEHGFARAIALRRERAYSPGNLLRGMLGPDPVTVLNYWSPSIAAALEQLLRSQSFDTVQIEGVHLIRYLPLLRTLAPSAAIVADWHNIESEILRRYAETSSSGPRAWLARRTAQLVERAEGRLLRGADVQTLASDREREKLARLYPEARLYTVTNGVDVGYYRETAEQNQLDSAWTDVIFVGSMDYHANVDAIQWMVREVWPEVKRHCPDLHLRVVGRNPGPEVRSLAAADIEITGTVEDVRPFYRNARAVVAPLRVGSGTRLKILEAMAAGVPVVSTPLGAEGLNVRDGADILLSDTPAGFADCIAALEAGIVRRRLVQAALELVEKQYDWLQIGAQMLEIHREAARWRRAAA